MKQSDQQQVEYGHFRLEAGGKILPRGGVTVAMLVGALEGTHDIAGFAICSPHDVYCRRAGRGIALQRARARAEQVAAASSPTHRAAAFRHATTREERRKIMAHIAAAALQDVLETVAPNGRAPAGVASLRELVRRGYRLAPVTRKRRRTG